MAFKFRRTMKIAPGLRLNLTHRGVSARVGTKGAGYTVNANGSQHVSAGIPGSGIHVSQQVKPPGKRKKKSTDVDVSASSQPSSFGLIKIGAMMAFGGLIALILAAILT